MGPSFVPASSWVPLLNLNLVTCKITLMHVCWRVMEQLQSIVIVTQLSDQSYFLLPLLPSPVCRFNIDSSNK
jgi:hypothetical protein